MNLNRTIFERDHRRARARMIAPNPRPPRGIGASRSRIGKSFKTNPIVPSLPNGAARCASERCGAQRSQNQKSEVSRNFFDATAMKQLISSIVLLVTTIGCATDNELSRSATTPGASAVRASSSAAASPTIFDVRAFGAAGNGQALDSPAINNAIDAASAAGGGTVYFPAGNYLSVSIHLKSNIALYLDSGATIVAASPKDGYRYDPAEPNEFDKYQDFGHSHFHNSLIWGDGVQNVAILGPGLINGKGLVTGGSGSRTKEQNDALRPPRRSRNSTSSQSTTDESNPEAKPAQSTTDQANSDAKSTSKEPGGESANDTGTEVTDSNDQKTSATPTTNPDRPFGYPSRRDAVEPGWANKAICLVRSRNVVIRDVSILRGGHFAILATGVDNLTIDNLKLDTNRDGMDIDACRNVRIANCSVNSPFDDGICLKATYALGENRPCENMTITNCQVSGYDLGSFLDGTYKREHKKYSARSGPTGRIKFGTESNGGFKNISISNCVFAYCRGLALEEVDGGDLEDVTIDNITMRDVQNSPIFIRLGARVRAPSGTPVGNLRRVTISNINVYNADPRFSSIISGVSGHEIEDLKLHNIRIHYQGGGSRELATSQPAEKENAYPEPAMFGHIPAYGFFVRHVKGLEMRDIDLSYEKPDYRPAFVLDDVANSEFLHVKAQREADVPTFDLRGVEDFATFNSAGVADTKKAKAQKEKL
jgi:polygalacturonase